MEFDWFAVNRYMWLLIIPFTKLLKYKFDFLYSVGPHPVSSLHIYTFVVSRAFMAGAASQAGDADSSRAPGLTSGVQGSANVHRGALLLVPQWQCISSFVFQILLWWMQHLYHDGIDYCIWTEHNIENCVLDSDWPYARLMTKYT